MPETITASWSKLSDDAFEQSKSNFSKAIDIIDEKFGKGYAKANPTLISAFMQSSAIEYNGTTIGACIQQLKEDLESISSSIDYISDAIEKTK